MPKIQLQLQIQSCKDCPHHRSGSGYSTDGWDYMEDWICTQVKDPHLLNGSWPAEGFPPDQEGKKIAGAVSWYDKISVPDWCPNLCLEEKAKLETQEK